MKRWIIEKLGGYATIEDAVSAADKNDLIVTAIELVRDLSLEEKHRWLTLAVKRHFNTIGPDDVLKVHGATWTYKGKPLKEADMTLLKAEANQLLHTTLWEVLQTELAYQANKAMYTDSQSLMDLVAGKLMVYSTDTIKTVLKKITK